VIEFSGSSFSLRVEPVRRDCPVYLHDWYAEQADWIIVNVEAQARFDSGEFRDVFSRRDLQQLGDTLTSVDTKPVDWKSTSREETGLEFTCQTNGKNYDATFHLDRTRFDPLQFKYRYSMTAADVHRLQTGIETFLKQYATVEERWNKDLQDSTAIEAENGEMFLEYQGRCLAILRDPQVADMFWTSFEVVPISDSDQALQMMMTGRQGELKELTAFRFSSNGIVADLAIPSAAGIVDGRLSVRSVG